MSQGPDQDEGRGTRGERRNPCVHFDEKNASLWPRHAEEVVGDSNAQGLAKAGVNGGADPVFPMGDPRARLGRGDRKGK